MLTNFLLLISTKNVVERGQCLAIQNVDSAFPIIIIGISNHGNYFIRFYHRELRYVINGCWFKDWREKGKWNGSINLDTFLGYISSAVLILCDQV